MKITKPIHIRPIIFGLVCIAGCAALISENPEPPDSILIDNQGYEIKQKKTVGFDHRKHNEEYQVACAQCHHDYNEETINVWAKGDPVRKCAECHSPLNEDEILLNRLKTAYHKQCCQCHMEINKQGGSAPFENCEECHGKKP